MVNRHPFRYKRKVTEAAAQRLILKGGGSAALGFLIRLGARLLFVLMAGRLFGVTLFGAFVIAVAVVELAVTLGGAGMKRQLFKLLDEERGGRSPAHIVLDGVVLVTLDEPRLHRPADAGRGPAPARPARGQHRPRLAAARADDPRPGPARSAARRDPLDAHDAPPGLGALDHRALCRARRLGAGLGARLPGDRARHRLLGRHARRARSTRWSAPASASAPSGSAATACPRRASASSRRQTALPTLSDFTSALAGRLDLYLVGLFLGESPAGIYGMARQVRTPIRQVRQSFDGLLTPDRLAHAQPRRPRADRPGHRLGDPPDPRHPAAHADRPGRDRRALARLDRPGIRRRLSRHAAARRGRVHPGRLWRLRPDPALPPPGPDPLAHRASPPPPISPRASS